MVGPQIGQYYRDLVSARSWWNSNASANPVKPINNPPRSVEDFTALMMAPPVSSSSSGGGAPNPTAFGNSTMFDPNSPTFFKPFRSYAASVAVPDPKLLPPPPGGTSALTISYSPLITADNGLLRRVAAGVPGNALPGVLTTPEPLFAVNRGDLWSIAGGGGTAQTSAPAYSVMPNDPNRDPYFRFQLLTKLGGMFTTRSNVYAIWVTVGLFEVDRIPSQGANSLTAQLADPGFPNRDGYRIARELNASTGSTRRFRGFAIVDRTIPVGFQRGENYNVDKCFLIRKVIK
jgi:hypothetical protein